MVTRPLRPNGPADPHQVGLHPEGLAPRVLNFDPPLSLAPGDYLDYQCTHDNGVTRTVRRCGDSETDRNCTPGEPIPVTFGLTAQDEMCLLTGLVYSRQAVGFGPTTIR